MVQPLVSLEKSLELIIPQVDQLEQSIKTAKENCHFPNEHNLTKDESAALYLYSMECGGKSFYRVFNHALRSANHFKLVPWLPFLKLFHTALHKLPLIQGNIWRGLREDVSDMYEADQELTWWSVNSCSSSINVIKNFLGPNSTLFLIEAANGRSMSGYTKFQDEDEVILPPGTHLRVVSNALDHEGGLHVIHATELPSNHLSLPTQQLLTSIKRQKKVLLAVGVTLFVLAISLAVIGGLDLFKRQGKAILPPIPPLVDGNLTVPIDAQGSILCHQWARVRSCPSWDCNYIGEVLANGTYSSDCYTTGGTVVGLDLVTHSNKWYRLNLSPNRYGFVVARLGHANKYRLLFTLSYTKYNI